MTTAAAPAPVLDTAPTYDVERIRAEFPILATEVNGKPLAFLDSGASAQKPRAVLDRIQRAYSAEYANVHRGAYHLSQLATDEYEGARRKVAHYLNAASDSEIIFTRNATASVNLVSSSYGGAFLKAGDEIILSHMEHHANIVPWQLLRDQIGIVIKVAPIDDRGNFLLDEFEKLLTRKTKLGGDHACVQRPRHDRSVGRGGPAGACKRRRGAGGRGPRHRSHPSRRAGAGRRFLCFHRPQALRPVRHRRSLTARRRC